MTLTAKAGVGPFPGAVYFAGCSGCPSNPTPDTCAVLLDGADATPTEVHARFEKADATATPTAGPTVTPTATADPDDDDLDPTLQAGFRVRDMWTKVRKLRFVDLPRASVVTLRCKSEGDDRPFGRKKYDPTRGTLNLEPAFHGRKLRPHTVVIVRLDLTDGDPEDTKLVVRSGQPPTRDDD